MGIGKDCEPSIGGIKTLLLNLFDNVADGVIHIDAETGKITQIMLKDTDEGSKFRYFALPKNVANLQSSLTPTADNGRPFVTNVLTLVFNRMDTSKRMAISAMAVSDLCAIVQDYNGKWWFIGKDEPLSANGGDSGTGAAKTDRNGYGINLQSEEYSYPYEINVGGQEGQVNIGSLCADEVPGWNV